MSREQAIHKWNDAAYKWAKGHWFLPLRIWYAYRMRQLAKQISLKSSGKHVKIKADIYYAQTIPQYSNALSLPAYH